MCGRSRQSLHQSYPLVTVCVYEFRFSQRLSGLFVVDVFTPAPVLWSTSVKLDLRRTFRRQPTQPTRPTQMNDREPRRTNRKPTYLVLLGALGQNGAALPPMRPLVSFQSPQQRLLLVAVPQQDPQAALGLPLQLVVEEQAERASLRTHLGALQASPLALGVGAGIEVEVVP